MEITITIKDNITIVEDKEEMFNIVKRQSETTAAEYLNSYDFYK